MILIGLVAVYTAGIIALIIWGTVVGLRFKGTLAEATLPPEPPTVSVIVPARNEARNIDRCVRGLRAQDYPRLEMVFVDDDSTDATPNILAQHAGEDSRIKVIHTGGKPDGWNGKQWACHSGAAAATGEWVCFMDADTAAEPNLLTRTVAFALARGVDMLTLQPWYVMGCLWERIVMPMVLWTLLLVFRPEKINDPDDKMAIANGQFILMPRAVYDALGGHEAVRDRMMEDFPLARLAKGSGYRLYMADGAEVARVHSYTNLKEIRAGGVKAAVEISGGWLSTLVVTVINVIVNILPVVALLWALLAGSAIPAAILGGLVAVQVIFYAVLRIVAFRAPPWAAISYPLGGLIAAAITLEGMFRLLSGRGVTWRGRSLLGTPEPAIISRLKESH